MEGGLIREDSTSVTPPPPSPLPLMAKNSLLTQSHYLFSRATGGYSLEYTCQQVPSCWICK